MTWGYGQTSRGHGGASRWLVGASKSGGTDFSSPWSWRVPREPEGRGRSPGQVSCRAPTGGRWTQRRLRRAACSLAAEGLVWLEEGEQLRESSPVSVLNTIGFWAACDLVGSVPASKRSPVLAAAGAHSSGLPPPPASPRRPLGLLLHPGIPRNPLTRSSSLVIPPIPTSHPIGTCSSDSAETDSWETPLPP